MAPAEQPQLCLGEPALTARPCPQGIPRASSSDEECFFDLLSKFQSSRMDDQRCPLEEGQPAAAAEATASPSLEERIGEQPLLQGSRAGRTSCEGPVTVSSASPPRPKLPPGRRVITPPSRTQGVRAGVGGRALPPHFLGPPEVGGGSQRRP